MKLEILEKADQVDAQGESVSKTFMSAVASSKIGRETELFEQLNLKLQHLSAEQKFQLTKLITWHRDAFVLNLQELGTTNLVKHVVNTDHPPIKQLVRCMLFALRNKVDYIAGLAEMVRLLRFWPVKFFSR